MPMAVSTLDSYCSPYGELFSPPKNAESIKAFTFSLIKRQSAEKCHDCSPWLQKGSRCPVIHAGELAEVAENPKTLTQAQLDLYSTPEGIVSLNKEGIKIAIERRVALFFQQAILCYGMSSFTFSTRGADEQIGTSPAIKLATADGSSTIHKREAAHSSTVPALIAHAKDGSTPNGFIYLKGGSSHDQHNATIGMHECVNGADELIDGNGQDGKLRDTAVGIFNRVAQGLDPAKATEEFIRAFSQRIDAVANQLAAEDKRKLVLGAYRKKINKIQLAATQKVFYDRLIGVNVKSDDPREAKLREIIYKKRYDIIRLQEIVESRIGKRIDDVKSAMQPRDKAFIEYIVLKEFSETKERQILEKLIGKTAAVFEQEYGQKDDGAIWIDGRQQRSLKAFKTRVSNLQEKYKQTITTLKRDLRADFRELSCAEFSYRAGVFKDLRTKLNSWTQRKFCEHYLVTTGYKVSQSWVSRMEQLSRVNVKGPNDYHTPINQRRRYVTVEDARRCSDTFGVDAGIFLPCLFTS